MRKFVPYKPQPLSVQAVYEKYKSQIDALVDALEAGEPNVDLKLAAMVEGTPAQVRVAIVEKMREMIARRDAEKAKALEQMIEQQKLLEVQQREQVRNQFLAYFLSQETLRKLREAIFANPILQKQVENIGQDLARKGVIGQGLGSKQDLGELSANLQYVQKQAQDKSKDAGKGR